MKNYTPTSSKLAAARYKRLAADPERLAQVKAEAAHGKKVCDSFTRLFRGQATNDDLRRPELASLVIEMYGKIPPPEER